MRKGTLAAIVLGIFLVASPLLAQGDNPAGTSSQPSTQAGQSDPNATGSTQTAGADHITGTIVSLSATSLELKVEPTTGASTGAGAGMAGTTTSFELNAATDMPTGLRVGDRVSVWFNESNGTRPATRVALAATGSSSTDEGAGQGSTTASASSTTSATGTMGESSTSQAQPKTAAAAGTKHLPRTASQLPLVGLIGLLALATAVVMRFALRSS